MNIFKEKREPVKLALKVVVGQYGTLAVIQADSSVPNFWDAEAVTVGSLHPDDLGIRNVPIEPGEYSWEGTFKVWGPDINGDYDGEYIGHWKKTPSYSEIDDRVLRGDDADRLLKDLENVCSEEETKARIEGAKRTRAEMMRPKYSR